VSRARQLGQRPPLTEFSPKGDVLFDATLSSASYRGFRREEECSSSSAGPAPRRP